MAVGSGIGVGVGVGTAVGMAASSGVTTGAGTAMISVAVVHATAPRSASAVIPTIDRRHSIVELFSNIRVDSHDLKQVEGAVQNADPITV